MATPNVNDSVVPVTAENASAANATTKIPATPEGMAVAYGALVVMALWPIFYGSFRSVKFHKEQKESGEKPETMTTKDAAMFPIIASCTLFGLYIFFQIFSKEYINLLLAGYFFFLGIFALTHIVSPFFEKYIPESFPNANYHWILTQGSDENKIELMNMEFDRKYLACLASSAAIGAWYLLKKHWIANNLFGLAFAINGIELLSLNSVKTGCILLGGLFFYDIFWVFATNVMVTVAKSFEAPIKLVFPQDLLEKGLAANNFAMLGLGDIVIPGIFIALLLRYDLSRKNNSKIYFYTSFLAYFLGLALTVFIMHVFKHAQPALLYLVPACLGTPVLVALIKGDLHQLFSYEDNPEQKDKTATSENDVKTGTSENDAKTETKKDE